MHIAHDRSVLLLAGLALALACTPEPAPAPRAAEPEPAAVVSKAEPTPTKAEPTPTKTEPTKPAPEVPAPEVPAPEVPAPEVPAPLPTSTLRTVAVRQGMLTLLRQRDVPLVVVDGEPVTWVDDAFVRHPTGSKGLWSSPLPDDHDRSLTVAAVSLDEPLGAWTSSEHEVPRFASYYEVYQRNGDAWRQVPLRKRQVVAYYAAFVERDGALLALQSWASDASESNELDQAEPDEESETRQAALDRALERTKQSWVRIAGSEAVVAPEIPKGMTIHHDVTTTSDGTIVALASGRPDASGSSKTIALAWRPGQAKPDRIEVPDAEQTSAITLGSSGEWALVAGMTYDEKAGSMESYLAVGRGSDGWKRVPVSLPGRSSPELPCYVSGAARLPDGELWIALSDPYLGGEGSMGTGGGQIVWRKPIEGDWQPVPLPALRDDASGRMLEPYHATALFSTTDAVWIAVGAGSSYDSSEKEPTRSAVLTTRPGAAPPTVLPSEEELRRERNGDERVSLRKP